jgi:hypothetical protein
MLAISRSSVTFERMTLLDRGAWSVDNAMVCVRCTVGWRSASAFIMCVGWFAECQ